MRIIDLSQKLYHNMPVYPGDPEVVVEEIHTLAKEGWNLRSLSLTTHIGTHVNVPYHMVEKGKRLSEFSLDAFCGDTELYKPGMTISKHKGILFTTCNIDKAIADVLVKTPPKFIGLSEKFEFDIALEKLLLEHNIISFENLTNTDKLPDQCIFYGMPLNIADADGSPVRAFVLVP